jgi:arylsulfatase A
MNKPNIIIFYTDDQGTLDVGCYGSKDLYTPNMDALANKGVRFTQAYSHTVCCPSRAALLTGRYPQRCGINDWTSNHPSDEKKTNMSLDEITIAQYLKKDKYKTALIGKWHCGANLKHGPNNFGFDFFSDIEAVL